MGGQCHHEPMSFLDAVSVLGAEVVEATTTDGSKRRVLNVLDPNALTQIVGHAKFRSDATVLVRGHSRLHPTLTPTLFRDRGPAARKSQTNVLVGYLRLLLGGKCKCEVVGGPPTCVPNWPCQASVMTNNTGLMKNFPQAAVEPLLQHYGVRTRWVDAVDNVWVALWFACHELQTRGRYGHHSRRNPDSTDNEWAYLTLIDVGSPSSTACSGIYRSDRARLVDLRVAVPSMYLRPHAQHALLFASRDWSADLDPSLSHLEMATLRISLREALVWLGNGISLTPYVLFPPADKDEGFRRLLDYSPAPPESLGSFIHYGPGW